MGSGELLRICRLLQGAARVKSYGRHDTQEESSDCLDNYFDGLEPLTLLSGEIERCILSEEEISDDASSTLRSIRRSMESINGKIHATLNNLVNGSLRTYLQDPIITMRGDRYCLPVKAEYRGQVHGLIHDQSSTGSTLFIEPMAVVKLNNDLKELYAKEQEEIQVILSRLSEEAASYIEEIRTDYRILTDLDFIFARGSLALSMNASRPTFKYRRQNSYPGRAPSTFAYAEGGSHHRFSGRRFFPADHHRSKYRRKDGIFKNGRAFYPDGTGRSSHSRLRPF